MDENNMDYFKDISDEEKECILKAAANSGRGTDPGTQFIGADDTFDFQCQQCGGCCMHRGDIILTGWDVFKAAKYLGITCADFLRQYTTRTIGNNSKIPMVLLKSNDDGFCPFLKFDYLDDGKFKCTINPAKPGACASHPIGMVSSMNTDENADYVDVDNIKTSFIKMTQCPQSQGHNELHVVKDWMKHFTDYREESLKAHELTIMTADLINWRGFFLMAAGFATALGAKKTLEINEEDQDLLLTSYSMVCSMLIEYAYAHFDTNMDFIEQIDENRAFLKERFEEMETVLYDHIEELFNDVSNKTLGELLKEGENTDLSRQVKWLSENPLRYKGCTMGQAEDIAMHSENYEHPDEEEEGDDE